MRRSPASWISSRPRGREARIPAAAGLAAAVAAALIAGAAHTVAPPAAGAEIPSSAQILNRVVAMQARAPKTGSADAALRLRIHRPASAPPDCVFAGALTIEHGRQTLQISQGSAGVLCWVANQLAVGHLFESSEPLEAILGRFDFRVTDTKQTDGRPFYLVEGKAKNPADNIKTISAWVDYTRGLVTSGTVEYSWGRLDADQQYTQMNRNWILTRQYLFSPKFDASLEILYTNFKFGAGR